MFMALALLLAPLPATAQIVSGNATALDGDTLEMTGQRMRLSGIDAPELAQKCQRDGADWDCGAQARRHLGLLLQSGEAQCTVQAQDSQGVYIATCTVADRDLSEAMVAAGLAVASEVRPGDAPYADLEARVRMAKAGTWAGTFDWPSNWRKVHPQARLSAGAGTTAPRAVRSARAARPQSYRNAFGCAIKGNVSHRDGQYIYYLPGMKYYDGTRPEQLFCTEAEAQAAGYRRSRGG